MRFLLVVAMSTALAAVASAFPTGAGTCLSNATIIQAGGGGAMGKFVPDLGFTLSVGLTDTYTPGDTKPVSVKVQGKMQFKGVLIYAIDSNKQHVGQWIPSIGTHFKEGCLGEPNATLTHSSATPKGPDFGMLWIPPAQSAGDIFFTGALVTGPQTGFQILKSGTFKSSTGGTAAPAVPAVPAASATPSTETTAIGDGWSNSTSTSYGMSVPAATPATDSPTSAPAASPTGAPSTGGAGGQVQFQTVTALDPSVSSVVATASAGAIVPNLAANEAPPAATSSAQISLTSGAGRSGTPAFLQQLMITALSVKFLLAFL